MPDPRQNVYPGQKLQIAAEQINFLNRMMRQGGGFGSGGLAGWTQGTNVVMARNDTGSDVSRFGVMEIDGFVIDPEGDDRARNQFSDMPCVIGVTPDVPEASGMPTSRVKKICVTMEPIKAGKLGRVVVSGPTPVRLGSAPTVEGVALPFAVAISGSTSILGPSPKSDSPAQILYQPEQPGGLGLVLLQNSGQRFYFGKNSDNPWLPGTRAYVELYENGPLEEPSGGGFQAMNQLYPVAPESWVTIWNAPDGDWWLLNAAKWDYFCVSCVVAGHDLSQLPTYSESGIQVLAHEDGCLKWISTSECPPS